MGPLVKAWRLSPARANDREAALEIRPWKTNGFQAGVGNGPRRRIANGAPMAPRRHLAAFCAVRDQILELDKKDRARLARLARLLGAIAEP